MIVLYCEGCRIELEGVFALQDAETLLREFPELKVFEVPEGQLSFFDQEVDCGFALGWCRQSVLSCGG